MTTIWRKLLVAVVVVGVLGMAGIYEIVDWLARHGVPQMAEGFRERYLTGTAVAVSAQECMALEDALKDTDAARFFFSTLITVLACPTPERGHFEPYIAALTNLPAEVGRSRVATWPVLTLLPFLAKPVTHMFLKPEVTKAAAERLAFNLDYDPKLNWRTYLSPGATFFDRPAPRFSTAANSFRP